MYANYYLLSQPITPVVLHSLVNSILISSSTKMERVVSNNMSWWSELRNNHDELTVLVVTISALILAVLWYTLFKISKSSAKSGKLSLPPGPISLPIVGYLPFLGSELQIQFTNMARTYGPIFSCKLGSKRFVVISNPELAREVVRDQDKTFSNRDQTVAALAITLGGKDIAISHNNENWRKLRKIFVRDMLSNKNLEASGYFGFYAVRKTIKNVFGKLGTPIDIREFAFSTGVNVITRMVWGKSLEAEEGEIYSNFGAELDTYTSNVIRLFGKANLSDFFPILARFDLQGIERDMKKQRDKMDQIFTTIIKQRIESNSKELVNKDEGNITRDFLQILLDYKDEKDGTSLNMTQIKALLVDIMFAGTDTTATTMEWAMACIIHNHNVMNKVKEELVEIVGLNNIVEESHIPKLKYLYATVKETLRMYPTIPFLLPRTPSEECVVGGYMIPKGCAIFLNAWSIHRDPQNWDNPLEFKPERFLTDKYDTNGHDMKYFPFGSGRRICAGLPMAEKMLMLLLASFFHSFDWSFPEGEEVDFTEQFGITIKKRKPLVALPSQRLSDLRLYM